MAISKGQAIALFSSSVLVVIVIILIVLGVLGYLTPSVDCEVSAWGPCDPMTGKRKRTVIKQKQGKGKDCPILEEDCPVNCQVSAWGPCVDDKQTRTVTTQAKNGGVDCGVLQQTCFTPKHLCNASNKCIATRKENNNIIQWDKLSNDPAQLWVFESSGNICNAESKKCLAASANDSRKGTGIIAWDKTDEKGQIWSFNEENLCNQWGQCLAAAGNGAGNGDAIIQWDKTTENGQKWKFTM